MLGTLLTSLQSLISASFVAGVFLPSLAFWFANAAILYVLNPGVMASVPAGIAGSGALATIPMAAALIGIALFAYVLSAILPNLQAALEGGNWPAWLDHFLVPAQMRRLEQLDEQEAENRKLRGSLRGQTQVEAWQTTLRTARIAGNAVADNTYTWDNASAKSIRRLSRRRRAGLRVLRDDLNKVLTEFAIDLRQNNANVAGPQDYGSHLALNRNFDLLWSLTEYAGDYAVIEYNRLKTTRRFDFGSVPLAPTRMGNVAKSVRHYAERRYNFNIDLFWSRLQLPVQRDKDFGPLLQAAKTKLDFLVCSSVLTTAWGIGWALWVGLCGGPKTVFLLAAAGGPILGYLWYRVAVAHYQTFADLLRSSIDLFRLDLLAAIHIPQPDGAQQERDLWEALDALTGLFENRDLRYTTPK